MTDQELVSAVAAAVATLNAASLAAYDQQIMLEMTLASIVPPIEGATAGVPTITLAGATKITAFTV